MKSLWLLVCAWPGIAAAQLDPDGEIARRHFELGKSAYERADYVRALTEFEAARLVKPLPAFDYNIARCHDRLEHYEEAIAAYQRFLSATPDASDASELHERVRVLRERLDKLHPRAIAALPAPAPIPPPPRAPRRGIGVPLSLGLVSLAVVAAGGGTWGSVGPGYDALQASCAPRCDPGRWSGLRTREQAGIAVTVVGLAGLAGDAVLWILRARGERARRPALSAGY